MTTWLSKDRPFSSFEIQERYGRMPTKEERRAFGRWRSNNPDVPLSVEDAARKDAEKRAAAERHARMSESEQLQELLAEKIGHEAADAIRAMVWALIEERSRVRSA